MSKGSATPDYLTIGFEMLDRELRLLMECFREVLVELGHDDLAAHLPWLGNTVLGAEAPWRLGLAYSVAFQLLNMVEEHAAGEMRKLREDHAGLEAERGLWGSQLARLRHAGFSREEILEIMGHVRVEPVLTAHPTEAKRLAVLHQHRLLFEVLDDIRHLDAEALAHRGLRESVKAALERLWRTGEILLEKPTLADERRNVLHYLCDVFPSVLPALDERLVEAWTHAGFPPEDLYKPGALPRIRFGTWVGGDRDGHPGVTAEITAATLAELRTRAVSAVREQLEQLAERLSLSTWMQDPPVSLQLALGTQTTGPLPVPAAEDQPWRRYIEHLITKLPPATGASPAGSYTYSRELLDDLDLLAKSLEEIGAARLAEADISPVRRIIEVFGFHLAQLDIRQNSVFHAKALTQLLGAAGVSGDSWDDWSEAERLRFLERELRSPRPFLHPSASAGPEADAVIGCYRVLAKHMKWNGPNGIGSLIISMTRRVSDLLVVYLLAREAGLLRAFPEGIVCLLPVVPLFETIEDLEQGPEMLRAFLEQPVTRRSLAFQAERAGRKGELLQQVMVGYSDSNKDGGIFASQWALQKAQGRLAEVGRVCGATLSFFHGRGGTVSRGAGPTHRFLDALPHRSLSGHLRLTEQGETIAQKYANPDTATYNLELLLAGTTATAALHARPGGEDVASMAPIMEKLAAGSKQAYRALLEHEHFMPFYRQATPIDALEHSRIGSRPSRRSGQATLADLRAIPWVFSWNQARFYVPGWFGAGSGLASLSAEELDRVAAEVRHWPFLHYVLTNVESSLASSDPVLMKDYSQLVAEPEVRQSLLTLILSERDLTMRMIERIRGVPMVERRPRMLKTLELRAEALRVLHHQQIVLLREWRDRKARHDDASADAMLPDLLLSINAIASGLRTTG